MRLKEFGASADQAIRACQARLERAPPDSYDRGYAAGQIAALQMAQAFLAAPGSADQQTFRGELVQLLAKAIATEGYTNPEEAFADGVSRKYCEDYAAAALKAIADAGYLVVPCWGIA